MISIKDFKMMIPKVNVKKLPPNVAIYAENCQNDTGVLSPISGNSFVDFPERSEVLAAIYKCGDTWLTLPAFGGVNGTVPTRYDFVRAPSANGRVYYTDAAGWPVHTDEALCISGGIPSEYPSVTFPMGVQRPAAALSVGLTIYDGGFPYGDLIGTVSYVYTIVSRISAEYTEESAPSPPSLPVPIRGNEQVTLTGFDAGDFDPADIYFRVYRSIAGEDYGAVPTGRDGNGDFVFDMDGAEAEFVDLDVQTKKIYLNVNISCETIGWDVLPYGAANLCRFQNGIHAATFGKKVYLSVLFVPYAFPKGISTPTMDYTYEFPTAPSRIASFRDMLIVGLGSNPYVIMGSDPSNMQIQEMAFNQACIGDMCVTEIGVFYPSPDGLVLCDGVTALPVTENTYTIEQWRDLQPENLKMFYHNNKLVGFFKGTSNGFVFDFKGDKTVVSIYLGDGVLFVYGHMVPEEDKLYLLVDNDPWPMLLSAVIGETGTSLTLVFSKPVAQGTGYLNTDINLDASSGGFDIGVVYASGNGTNTHIYTIGKTIRAGETVTLDYNGRPAGLEDASGNYLIDILNFAVTNDSAENYSDILLWSGMDGVIVGAIYTASSEDHPSYHTAPVTGPVSLVIDIVKSGWSSVMRQTISDQPMPSIKFAIPPNGPFRIGVWHRRSSDMNYTQTVMVLRNAADNSQSIRIGVTNTNLRITGNAGNSGWSILLDTPGSFIYGTWIFFEISLDPTSRNIRVYANGDLVVNYTHGTAVPVDPYNIVSLEETNTVGLTDHNDNLIVSNDVNRNLYALSLLEAYPGV